MYREQEKRDEPLYLTFTDRARQIVNQACSFVTEHWKREGVRPELHSCLRRAAVRALRIAGMMRLLRHHEKGQSLFAPERVEVGTEDMEVGLRLSFTYLVHALQIAEQFGVKDERQDLRRDQLRFLETLPDEQFETADAKEIADEVGTNPRTAQRWLKDWATEKSLVEKVSRGTWKKINFGRDSERVPGVISVISVICVIFDDEMGPIGEIPDTYGDRLPENESSNSAAGAGQ